MGIHTQLVNIKKYSIAMLVLYAAISLEATDLFQLPRSSIIPRGQSKQSSVLKEATAKTLHKLCLPFSSLLS